MADQIMYISNSTSIFDVKINNLFEICFIATIFIPAEGNQSLPIESKKLHIHHIIHFLKITIYCKLTKS